MKLIAFSDAHVDAVTAGLERMPEAERALEQIVRTARDEQVDAVVFAGDWCDPDSPSLVRCITLACDVARQCGDIRSWWMAGNHDVLEDGNGTTVLDPVRCVGNARVITTPAFYGPLAFLPYTASTRTYDPALAVRDFQNDARIVFSHLMVEGIERGSESDDFARGRDLFLPIDVINERFPRATIVQAHYHSPCVFQGIHVIGSLLRLTRGEASNLPRFLKVEI